MTATHIRRLAFTLIELLVVIAIIGLLVSMLVPSLSRAREQAKGALCLSNLRQLSHGWHAYADENRDISVPGRFAKLPGGKDNPGNWYKVGNGLKYRPRWVATTGKHVGLLAFVPSPVRVTIGRTTTARSISARQRPNGLTSVTMRTVTITSSSAMLGRPMAGSTTFPSTARASVALLRQCSAVTVWEPLQASRCADESKYSNNGRDYAALGNHGWNLDPPRLTESSDHGSGDPDSPRTAVDPRHRGRANMVFCDGHGESAAPENLGYRVLPDGAYVDLETVENPPTNSSFSRTGLDADPPDLPQ